jgi:hypothetical protein
MRHPRTPRAWIAGTLVTLVLALPAAGRAELRLLDEALVPPTAGPELSVTGVLLDQADATSSDPKGPAPAAPASGDAAGMDFDLLGAAKPPPDTADAAALRRRRTMLTAHQAIGFGLVGLQLATTVVGQLNYSDRFGGPSTARYQLTHATLAYSTLGIFALNATVALLAPSPVKRSYGMDRVMVHRIAMFTAAAGMVGQGLLGAYTHQREGYLNQEKLATAHLAIGYGTLAAMAIGVGALVF